MFVLIDDYDTFIAVIRKDGEKWKTISRRRNFSPHVSFFPYEWHGLIPSSLINYFPLRTLRAN